MIAQFVQFAPDLLARLIESPTDTEDLFATLPPTSSVTLES
jgi:hypothetical protein